MMKIMIMIMIMMNMNMNVIIIIIIIIIITYDRIFGGDRIIPENDPKTENALETEVSCSVKVRKPKRGANLKSD